MKFSYNNGVVIVTGLLGLSMQALKSQNWT